MLKECVIQFYKTINKLLCNLSFAGQYMLTITHKHSAVIRLKTKFGVTRMTENNTESLCIDIWWTTDGRQRKRWIMLGQIARDFAFPRGDNYDKT